MTTMVRTCKTDCIFVRTAANQTGESVHTDPETVAWPSIVLQKSLEQLPVIEGQLAVDWGILLAVTLQRVPQHT